MVLKRAGRAKISYSNCVNVPDQDTFVEFFDEQNIIRSYYLQTNRFSHIN